METLSTRIRGNAARLLQILRDGVACGNSLAGTFARSPSISPLELAMIDASEKSGQLPQGFEMLSGYFGQLEEARRTIWRKSLYPIFLLHFAVLALALPGLVLGTGVAAFLKSTIGVLLIFYIAIAIVYFGARAILKIASANREVDALLHRIPVVGKARRGFVLARFFTTFAMQVEAGLNLVASLEGASAASQSGLIRAAISEILPEVNEGIPPAKLLAVSDAFPPEAVRSWRVGEETGKLDAELTRLGAEFASEGKAAAELLASLTARALYFAVVIFVAWKILAFWKGYFQKISEIADPNG